MQQNAEVEAAGADIAAELTAGAFWKAFRRFHLYDDPALDEHVDSVETNLLTSETDGDRVFAIHAQSLLKESNVERPCIERLDKAISKLVVHLEEASNDPMTELPFNDGGV